MDVERKNGKISVSLTADEVHGLWSGRMIGTRSHVIVPDAKVEIFPLSSISIDESGKDKHAIDRFSKALAAPLKGHITPNGDIQIFVPEVVISDVRVAYADISRDQFDTPLSRNGQDAEDLKRNIPDKGVRVNFGGSLKIVDIGQITHSDEENLG